MPAYYNEIDPYASQWLRNLIDAGHIAPGVVDERSIEDVRPSDLAGFTQCHFFAGVGVWSLALRRAGWADDVPVWTGSCPCQPFSAAGAGAGFADPRHLWPTFAWLIKQCKPAVIFGEQVASKAVEPWVDLVHADMEALEYAFGAVPFPSAGIGAPHIRDRLYWVAKSEHCGRQAGKSKRSWPGSALPSGIDGGLADARQSLGGWRQDAEQPVCKASSQRGKDSILHKHCGDTCGLAHCNGSRCQPGREGLSPMGHGQATQSDRSAVRVANTDGGHTGAEREQRCGEQRQQPKDSGGGVDRVGAGPVNGLWADADWLFCRDGKWRPVSPKPQSLVDGTSESLGRVRAEVVAALEEEINAWSVEGKVDRDSALRNLLEGLGSQAKQCWSAGRLPGLHEAPFLLAFLRQLKEQGWRVAECLPLSCKEIAEGAMRGLRHNEESAGAPCEHGLEGQQAGECADALSVLSSLLARHASEAWDDAYAAHAEIGFPLAVGARSRVGRLRGYGNAINAEAATQFIAAYLES
jgi:site-specific DNA-cytosine methylase